MLPHRAGKFKSSVILCDMKQVCELSEDAARRVMSSTCSVSTSRSLAGLSRSSGQCGLHPSLHPHTLSSPNSAPHSKAQPSRASKHSQLGNYPQLPPSSIHLQARDARSSESHAKYFSETFFGPCAHSWPVCRVALAAAGRSIPAPGFTY